MTVFDGTVIENFQEEIILIDETTVSDGYGGYETKWKDGAKIVVGLVQPHDGSTTIANAIVGKQSITIMTGTDTDLKRDKYFKRVSNGKTYKLDRDNNEKLAPDDSTLQWRVTTATEAALPKNDYDETPST